MNTNFWIYLVVGAAVSAVIFLIFYCCQTDRGRIVAPHNRRRRHLSLETRPKPVVSPNPMMVYTVPTHGQPSGSTNTNTNTHALHTYPVRTTDNNDSILEIIGERNDRRNRENAGIQRNDARTPPSPIVASSDMPPSYDEAIRSPPATQTSAV